MKKFFITLAAFLPMMASAYDANVDGIYYNLSENEATVTFGSPLYSGSVVIPESVTYNDATYSVTAIGQKAFSGCTGLTAVTIPNSVTNIGESAFQGCSGLTEFAIPESVTSIGQKAFFGCTGLTAITIPESVTSISDWVFSGCTGLTAVTIPASVTNIGSSAFYYCSGLTEVFISENVTSIGSYAFKNCSGLTSMTIPNNVTSIGKDAFYGCTNITTVNVDCEEVGSWFSGIKSLQTLTLGDNVKSIGEKAFMGCTGLTAVTIPNGVTNIDNFAFSGCTDLTTITIPNSVTSVGSYTFSSCPNITTVNINSEEIGSWFSGIKTLQTLTFGADVKTIGQKAFSGCTGLTAVTIPESVTSIGESAFDGCSGLTAVTIPESVTSIGESAFSGCSGLTEVTIPEGVTTIGNKAFYRCDNLILVKPQMTTPIAIEGLTFTSASKATLYVPDGSKAAYKAAKYWNGFKKIMVEADLYNVLYMNDVEITSVGTGKQITLPIALKNNQQITGLQMDLYLPKGVTVAKDSQDKLLVSVVTGRMAGSYSLSCQVMEGGFVRIAGFSSANDAFTGNDGDILNVTLDIAEKQAEGDYKVQLKDIVLSDVNNTEYNPTDTEATIKVKMYAVGDADGSGTININDVVCVVNYIQNNNPSSFILDAADVNGDGGVDITDVTVLIDRYILLNNNEPDPDPQPAPGLKANAVDTTDYLYLDNLEVETGNTAEIAVQLSNTHGVRAVQGKVKLPEGFSFVTKSDGRLDVKNLNDRSEDFTLSCVLQSDGSMTFVHYSMGGYTYEGNDGGIFTFKVTSDTNVPSGTYDMSLTGVVLSIDGKSYKQPDFYGSIIADDVKGVTATEVAGNDCYDLQGRKLSLPQKGINIIRYSDGTARKVLMK